MVDSRFDLDYEKTIKSACGAKVSFVIFVRSFLRTYYLFNLPPNNSRTVF